jgi:hypothetical protein
MDALFGKSPKMPAIPEPPPAKPVEDMDAAAELARKRKSLEAARQGRKSLVIPASPSVSAPGHAGLRIPSDT